MSQKNSLLIFGLLVITNASAQMKQFDYAKSLKGITDQWHQIVLDDDVIGATTQNLNDLRIFGITTSGDTIEAPYILQVLSDKVEREKVIFDKINSSSIGQAHYFTFRVSSKETINEIDLQFDQSNFDWQVKLEGSQNQKEWFTVLEDYRILSIKNELTDYHFTKLQFPSSNYQYFRLSVESSEKPQIHSADINSVRITEGELQEYKLKKVEIKELEKKKQSEINLTFDKPARLSMIELHVADSFDYYRPIQIKYLSDSLKTEKGWIYSYKRLTEDVLTSLESNAFKFPSTTVRKLRITIDNKDNLPLNLEGIEARGFSHRLMVRFSVDADYYLTYGNRNSHGADYDISHFKNNIPSHTEKLTLGKEERLNAMTRDEPEPLITDNFWLWMILLPGIAVIVWFSLKMLNQKE